MSAGWSTVVLCAACFASGAGLTSVYWTRAENAELAALRERADTLSGELVSAERRVTAAATRRAQTREQGRALVAASNLRDVPLPDDVAQLLDAAAQATNRAAGGRQAREAALSGSRDAAVPGS